MATTEGAAATESVGVVYGGGAMVTQKPTPRGSPEARKWGGMDKRLREGVA